MEPNRTLAIFSKNQKCVQAHILGNDASWMGSSDKTEIHIRSVSDAGCSRIYR